MKAKELLVDFAKICLLLFLFLLGIWIAANRPEPPCDKLATSEELIQEQSAIPICKDISTRQLVLPIPEPKIPEWGIPDNPYILEIEEVCKGYTIVDDLDLLVYAVIKVESDFNPNLTSSAGCIGLMQVSPYWQKDRADALCVTDLWDPYSNILVGVDFLGDLYYNYANRDIVLTVMMYNMNFTRAKTMYYSGKWSQYAVDVFTIFDELKGG